MQTIKKLVNNQLFLERISAFMLLLGAIACAAVAIYLVVTASLIVGIPLAVISLISFASAVFFAYKAGSKSETVRGAAQTDVVTDEKTYSASALKTEQNPVLTTQLVISTSPERNESPQSSWQLTNTQYDADNTKLEVKLTRASDEFSITFFHDYEDPEYSYANTANGTRVYSNAFFKSDLNEKADPKNEQADPKNDFTDFEKKLNSGLESINKQLDTNELETMFDLLKAEIERHKSDYKKQLSETDESSSNSLN